MPARDVIVVGGSAGCLTALVQIVRDLPRDLPATVLVVVHTSPEAPSLLPEILARATELPVGHARDGEPVRHGRIVIAPPDRHLIVDDGHLRLTRGPHENRFRPAVDPLFRSAAVAYGSRVAGVVLSGMLDDGAYGLVTIKQYGGVAIVQEASEALFASMPMSAMQKADVDFVVPVAQIPPLLLHLARGDGARGATAVASRRGQRSTRQTRAKAVASDNGGPAPYACPDCGGALWETDDGNLLRFRCRIGHRFNAESLLSAQDDRLEAAMWTALRALEEAAALRRRLAERVRGRGLEAIAAGYRSRAAEAQRQADVIRGALEADLRAADVAARGAQVIAEGAGRRSRRTTTTTPRKPRTRPRAVARAADGSRSASE